jgi:hypothetical protein
LSECRYAALIGKKNFVCKKNITLVNAPQRTTYVNFKLFPEKNLRFLLEGATLVIGKY